ncbi:MAG: HDOD domain-containing protein [Gammaproteobacteria bacterium]|nr:HDOD domain-containing protein [Gammaproteobacteria bacterium]
MKHDPIALVQGITKVASLPTIYIKLEDAIKKPGVTNRQLTQIINEDAAMAARLLRIANSAFYGFPSKVDTVTQAISIIGVNQLRDLLLACSMVSVFENIPDDLVSMESFWRHSIACGVISRVLASLRHENNVERFFVAGLLHDIGRLVFYMLRPKEMSSALKNAAERGVLLYSLEKEMFGFDHAKIGGLLLKTWRLPPPLVESTAYHHKPLHAKRYVLDACIVHVADVMANALSKGSSGENKTPPLMDEAWEIVGLPSDAIDCVIDKFQLQYNVTVNFILRD